MMQISIISEGYYSKSFSMRLLCAQVSPQITPDGLFHNNLRASKSVDRIVRSLPFKTARILLTWRHVHTVGKGKDQYSRPTKNDQKL